jgi:uncharacterized protein YndB with AHSA1/START domain
MVTRLKRTRAQFSIERTYPSTIEEVWELWTTKTGIESWWGPEGFEVTVKSLDVRAGGELVYLMTATASKQRAFMEQAGMPVTTEARVTYIEVTQPTRLVYQTLADFIPGVPDYEVNTVVDLRPVPGGVKLTITIDAMHDETWTERSRAGNESQMRKLDALLAHGHERRTS